LAASIPAETAGSPPADSPSRQSPQTRKEPSSEAIIAFRFRSTGRSVSWATLGGGDFTHNLPHGSMGLIMKSSIIEFINNHTQLHDIMILDWRTQCRIATSILPR